MKPGFYCSPDGRHIIEIENSSLANFECYVTSMNKSKIEVDYIYIPDACKIFSCWAYLGEVK
jgi:hypothetical protein